MAKTAKKTRKSALLRSRSATLIPHYAARDTKEIWLTFDDGRIRSKPAAC